MTMQPRTLLFLSAGLLSLTCSASDPIKPVPPVEQVPLQLPKGFTSVTFARHLGRARHLAVNTNGDVFVKLERLNSGKGIVQLKDKNGDGQADDSIKFGDYIGTGIAIKNGYLDRKSTRLNSSH